LWDFTGALDRGYAGGFSPKPEVSRANECGHVETVALVTFVEEAVPSFIPA
jgi:hypothetical protein